MRIQQIQTQMEIDRRFNDYRQREMEFKILQLQTFRHSQPMYNPGMYFPTYYQAPPTMLPYGYSNQLSHHNLPIQIPYPVLLTQNLLPPQNSNTPQDAMVMNSLPRHLISQPQSVQMHPQPHAVNMMSPLSAYQPPTSMYQNGIHSRPVETAATANAQLSSTQQEGCTTAAQENNRTQESPDTCPGNGDVHSTHNNAAEDTEEDNNVDNTSDSYDDDDVEEATGMADVPTDNEDIQITASDSHENTRMPEVHTNDLHEDTTATAQTDEKSDESAPQSDPAATRQNEKKPFLVSGNKETKPPDLASTQRTSD